MSDYATYCPEDNKLRLYVGRVPREEYLKLRAEGWTSTPKQNCDFVATWTPERRDTCLEYAGIIDDEDQPPEERAADRAERFSGYRDKRTEEATGRADAYDAGPSAHGYQSPARAERAAAKHNQIADRACDAWSKAEYWTTRTDGVIRHALYKSTPGVRMGRIKILEAELRAMQARYDKSTEIHNALLDLKEIADPVKQTELVKLFFGQISIHREYAHPDDPQHVTSLYCHLTTERRRQITGAEALALYFSDHSRPDIENNDWATHYKLRLAYENQMLAAQGGRLEQCEVLPGGKLGNRLIIKVSKSTATGRPTSCDILGDRVTSWTYKASNLPGTEWAAYKFDLERLSPDAYTPPTPESLKYLEEVRAKIKVGAKKSKGDPCPLINPTDEDAERLQKVWNEAEKDTTKHSQVVRMTQAQYSALSAGTYARCKTVVICETGCEHRTRYGRCITRANLLRCGKQVRTVPRICTARIGLLS
jgi:hypothetical protein